MKNKRILVLGLAYGLLLASACGIKGPPLPPIAATPQASDKSPHPYPSPSPSPAIRNSR